MESRDCNCSPAASNAERCHICGDRLDESDYGHDPVECCECGNDVHYSCAGFYGEDPYCKTCYDRSKAMEDADEWRDRNRDDRIDFPSVA